MITAHELTLVADLTYRQVDHWTRAGYLLTVGDPTPGSGSSRAYDDDQVNLAIQLSRLTKTGIPVNIALPIAIDLLDHGHADIGGFLLAPIAGPELAGDPLPDVVRHIHREAGAA